LQRFRLPAVAALTLSLTVAILAASTPMASAQESAANSAASDTTKAAKPRTEAARSTARAEKKAAKRAAKDNRKAVRADKAAKDDAEDRQSAAPWQRDANWLSLRFGYAKSAADHHANGDIGGGFGYYHFFNRRWAAGVHTNVDMLGRFQGATEISIPVTFEMTRHIKWASDVRPYVGAGLGAFYYHATRTGEDYSIVRPGMYLTGGFNTPIADRSLIGLDLRLQWSNDAASENAVFPDEGPSVMHWSVKLNYLRWH
jgi:outer membrane protein W